MTQPGAPGPLGMSDFFALEAGEYLDRLDALLQPPAPPAAEELVRLARALRGSALMASQQAIARAAMGLEALARGVREGRRPWDAATKQFAIRAVDDLKIFVRKAANWTDADTAKAEALGSQLEQLGGRPSGQVRAAEAMGLDAGARAFVAREGAAIASALDRAGRALRNNPMAHDPLQQVLKALQPLRGLAALTDLPPLPDLLDGIERAIGELSRTSAAPPPGMGDRVAELFQMAATSIAHAAREVAERGRPDPESAEFRKFAGLLVHFMDGEPDVVPIETVGTIVRRGTPPGGEGARPATLGRLELVSHGEHLRQAADSLERAPSATQRELRAHTLAGTFRALGSVGGGAVAERVAEFAQAARDAVSSGIAVNQPALFAAELRKAGEILSASGTGDETATAAALAGVTLAVRHIGGVGSPTPPPTAAAPPRPPPPAAAPTRPADRAPASVAARAPSLPPPIGVESSTDLAGTWTRYQQMVAAGVGPASLQELIAGGPSKAGNGGEPVDIKTLLYKGAGARRRAQELREAAKRASGDSLRAIIDEVCDLVVLAIEPE
jgi:HPt (histidine-containing phosphotransfer) domain-containing protein